MKDCYKNNSVKREMAEFKYCECAMYKENIDTIQAVNLIVKHLRFETSSFVVCLFVMIWLE